MTATLSSSKAQGTSLAEMVLRRVVSGQPLFCGATMWAKLPSNHGMGLEAQELLRWHNKPVACIKKRADYWECSLLHLSGISAVPLVVARRYDLEQVKLMCEAKLVEMGWEAPKRAKA